MHGTGGLKDYRGYHIPPSPAHQLDAGDYAFHVGPNGDIHKHNKHSSHMAAYKLLMAAMFSWHSSYLLSYELLRLS